MNFPRPSLLLMLLLLCGCQGASNLHFQKESISDSKYFSFVDYDATGRWRCTRHGYGRELSFTGNVSINKSEIRQRIIDKNSGRGKVVTVGVNYNNSATLIEADVDPIKDKTNAIRFVKSVPYQNVVSNQFLPALSKGEPYSSWYAIITTEFNDQVKTRYMINSIVKLSLVNNDVILLSTGIDSNRTEAIAKAELYDLKQDRDGGSTFISEENLSDFLRKYGQNVFTESGKWRCQRIGQ